MLIKYSLQITSATQCAQALLSSSRTQFGFSGYGIQTAKSRTSSWKSGDLGRLTILLRWYWWFRDTIGYERLRINYRTFNFQSRGSNVLFEIPQPNCLIFVDQSLGNKKIVSLNGEDIAILHYPFLPTYIYFCSYSLCWVSEHVLVLVSNGIHYLD